MTQANQSPPAETLLLAAVSGYRPPTDNDRRTAMMPLNSTAATPLASADRSPLGMSDHSPNTAGPHAARDGAGQQARTDRRADAATALREQTAGHAQTPAQPTGGQPTGGQATGRSIQVPKIKSGLPLRKRPHEVRRIAIEVFPAADSWIVFYREILGVDGVARKLFKTVEEVRHWEASEEFLEVQEMLTALRSSDPGKGESVEPQRMITVRLPTSLHESLKVEADEHQTSMNKLCMSKLLMSIDGRFVPIESGRIRGRKPGPQGKRKPAAEQVAGEER